MKTLFLIFTLSLVSNHIFCQTTAVPDANFEQQLINLGYDTGVPDGSVPTSAIDTVESLNVINSSISDLTGIEDFSSLKSLWCSNNDLTTIDISQNVSLVYLGLDNNQLAVIDLSQNTALTQLFCTSNVLNSIDVSANDSLTLLYVMGNQLTSLDVTQNDALEDLKFNGNQISTIDLSQNSVLSSLNCSSNSLTNLDVSQNVELTYLTCDFNSLTSLDLSQNVLLYSLSCIDCQLSTLNISQNPSLASLNCSDNMLTNLDFSQNGSLASLHLSSNQFATLNVALLTSLSSLSCSNNLLTCLNVKNGNNSNFFAFEALNNPNLLCIEVDDTTWSATNWTNIDPASTFSTYCQNNCSLGIDEAGLSHLSVFPNPTNNILNVENASGVAEIVDVFGKVVLESDIINEQVDVTQLPSGVYMLFVKSENGVLSIRFIKE